MTSKKRVRLQGVPAGESAERANSRWRFYVIPDLMTQSTNAGKQTPLERYDSFEELRVQPYNDGETPRRDALSYARLTLGIESPDGESPSTFYKSADTKRMAQIIWSRMESIRSDPAVRKILPFDEAAAVEYGRIRAFLQRRGVPIGPLDTLIAAHAKSENMTLVTNNTREFARVPGLKLANWAED